MTSQIRLSGITGTLLGGSSSAQYLGQVAGRVVGGFVGGHFGMRPVFLATGALLAAGAVFNWCAARARWVG